MFSTKHLKSYIILYVWTILLLFILTGCRREEVEEVQNSDLKNWLIRAKLDKEETKEELYEAALQEDTLRIYTVTTRVFDVKELFEKEYPGLTVDINHLRSNDLVSRLLQNYEQQDYQCDLVLCSNNDGSLYKELIEPGFIYPYIPKDIAPKMKEGHAKDDFLFLGETLMLFYNQEVFDEIPINNIWELTEDRFKGRIIMANPLRSFSTYGFCAMLMKESKMLEEAYLQYKGETPRDIEEKTLGEVFLEQLAPNIVFTNSSDEVAEGIGNSGKDGMAIGIMISSKMRLLDIGYHFAPIYNLEPFSAVYTPNSIMIAGGAENINTAKLFIRYIMGETDGTGEGRLPYATKGTWSTRIDVPDGNDIPLTEMDLYINDKEYIYDNKEYLHQFFSKLLNENIKE